MRHGEAVDQVYALLLDARDGAERCGLDKAQTAIQTALNVTFLEARNFQPSNLTRKMKLRAHHEHRTRKLSQIQRIKPLNFSPGEEE